MTSDPHPGSIISIGSSSDGDQPSTGTKRAREDDSEDDTSSSGSSRSRSESPESKVDAVSMSRRKGAKRQRAIQESVEASNIASPEEGEMSEDSRTKSFTRRVTRSQSRRLESPEKQATAESSSQSNKTAKKKKKKKKKQKDRAKAVDWVTPGIPELGLDQTPEQATEAWCRDFFNANRADVKLIRLNSIRDIFLAQIPLSGHLSNKNANSLKKCIRDMKRGGRLTQLQKEVRDGWTGDAQDANDQTTSERASSNNVISIPSESEEEYEPTMGLPIIDTSRGSQNQASAANGTSGTLENGNNKFAVGDEALRQQRRYFPSASEPSSMCLLCGRSGHLATSCPHLVCRFCSSHDHADFACPARVRCDKCRQLGHASKSCTEKLALTKAEGLACSFCAANDHLEQECTEPWRSFHPEQEVVHTVAFIAPSCSSCGVEGEHYSGDCQNIRVSEVNPTWTLRNHDRYVDTQATDKSIEEDAAGALAGVAPQTRAPEMRIRGHAKTQHIQFHDSDSETEFLGQPSAKGRAPIGQIPQNGGKEFHLFIQHFFSTIEPY
ncbi:hypothetical protein CC79DRAFT_1325548 [Sarocladium strictum]